MTNTTNGREQLEERARALEEREKKLSTLQESFESLIPFLREDKRAGHDIPDIRESMDGVRPEETIRPGLSPGRRLGLKFLVAIAVAALLFVKFPWTLDVQGEARPSTRAVIKAPFDGVLEDIRFPSGAHVRSGDLLAHIRSADWRTELEKKREQIRVVLRQEALRREDALRLEEIYERTKRLFEDHVVPAVDLDRADGDRRLAWIQRGELEIGRKELEAQEAHLHDMISRAELRSPTAGVIVTQNLTEKRGVFFETGDSLFEVADLSHFVIEAMVPEKRLSQVKVGQRARVRLESHARWFEGAVAGLADYSGKPLRTLDEVLAEGGNFKKGIIVRIEFRDPPKDIKYGMDARVKIRCPRESLLRKLFGGDD
ncbi:MAG: efflux RND transporter periplasmic adaptor subunit [Elusimicrobia bacterium]|nr:efflux RND transporter periplasmic adaptor subunit [Elusimicrobiota bacterium]